MANKIVDKGVLGGSAGQFKFLSTTPQKKLGSFRIAEQGQQTAGLPGGLIEARSGETWMPVERRGAAIEVEGLHPRICQNGQGRVVAIDASLRVAPGN